MNELSESNSIAKIKVFDGKKENYAVWRSQFMALCSVKGVRNALDPNFKSELPATEDEVFADLANNEGAQKKAIAREKNMLAFSYLTLAMGSPGLLAKLEASKNDEWPSGLACDFWAKLEKKYKPSDTIAVAEQSSKLMKLKLKKDEDPEDLGDKIAALESEYASTIDEKQKIAAVVNASGQHYSDVIRQETKNLEAASEDVTAEALIEAMAEKWRISGSGKKDDADEDERPVETALSHAHAGIGRRCFKCGETGHFARDCKKMGQNQRFVRFTGECRLCHMKGHKEADCWENEENASKRPENWKSKMTGAHAGAALVEVLIPSIDIGMEEAVSNVEVLLTSVDISLKEADFISQEVADSQTRISQEVADSQTRISLKGADFISQEVADSQTRISQEVADSQTRFSLKEADSRISQEVADSITHVGRSGGVLFAGKTSVCVESIDEKIIESVDESVVVKSIESIDESFEDEKLAEFEQGGVLEVLYIPA